MGNADILCRSNFMFESIFVLKSYHIPLPLYVVLAIGTKYIKFSFSETKIMVKFICNIYYLRVALVNQFRVLKVNEPIPKIEGQSQCTGEAEYVNDIPLHKGELFGAFVISNVASCDVDVVDPSPALVRITFIYL